MRQKRNVAGVLGVLVASVGGIAGAAIATGGGARAAERPVARSLSVDAIRCVSSCLDVHHARAGSLVRLDGQALADVDRIIFRGDRGDGVVADPAFQGPDAVYVVVPVDARTGELAVDSDSRRTLPSAHRIRIARTNPDAVRAQISSRRIFVAGRRTARLDLEVRDTVPLELAVQLVRARDRAVLRRWRLGAVAPGSVQSVVWRGRHDGSARRLGRYRFRVLLGAGTTAAKRPLAERTFDLFDHKFPVRGPHGFGGYASRFGGGRGHQGQDVFASCGTSVQAARGGAVKRNAFHPRSGNYVVIDGAGTAIDYAYMHLSGRSPLPVGSIVHTGQELGYVGQTGRADGCHLHFEMWNGPWQTGGQPIDPLPFVATWDGYS